MFENFIQSIKIHYQGHDFLNEAELENGKRIYDVYDLDEDRIIETETNSKIVKSDADEIITFENRCEYCGEKAVFVSYFIYFKSKNTIKVCRSYRCVACMKYTVKTELITKA